MRRLSVSEDEQLNCVAQYAAEALSLLSVESPIKWYNTVGDCIEYINDHLRMVREILGN